MRRAGRKSIIGSERQLSQAAASKLGRIQLGASVTFTWTPRGRRLCRSPAKDSSTKARMPAPRSTDDEAPDAGHVTQLLRDWRKGDPAALERLTPIVYNDLMRLARARLKAESHDCTLQPTALVHESYLRLAGEKQLPVENRAHFYAVAANIMRRVLVDYARKRKAQKRGAGLRVTLQTGVEVADEEAPDSLVLDDALRRLAEFDPRKAQAIELKYFGGLTTEQIGTVLGISVATVGRELRVGQAWLRRELAQTLR